MPRQTGLVRSHPVAGCLFILLGLGLFAAGAFGSWAPSDLPGPLPAPILVPFVLWQLGVWSVLFGAFFLRPRGRARSRRAPRLSF